MPSIFKRLRRRRSLAQQAPRRLELEAELEEFFGHPVNLTAAAMKGGYDEIYRAMHGDACVALVRVNNPFKVNNDPIYPEDPGVPLGPADRLDREWDAYSKLSEIGCAPKPIWRTHDAIACELIPWERASVMLARDTSIFWNLAPRLFQGVAKMHACGVTHLDLNPGNLLTEQDGDGVALIDFEFGPVDWVNVPQQMAYDYLRLIDSCVRPRRGGKQMLSDTDRLADLLQSIVAPEAQSAHVTFALKKLGRLAEQSALCDALRRVFPSI